MNDEKLIPLSYVSQYYYCRRRAALLMLEQQWNDSVDTVKGTAEHKNVHTSGYTKRNNIYTITEMQVISEKLGLIGKCDAVEAIEDENGIQLSFLNDKKYRLYPIEYKHGKLRSETEYELQLCAQAMCLEEMFSCKADYGAVYYISSHRRKEILLTDNLREKVAEIASALSDMIETYDIPKADFSSKCIKCSLKDICMPETETSVISYITQLKNELR